MKHVTRCMVLLLGISTALYGGNSQSNAVAVDSQGRILTAGLANNIMSVPSSEPDRTTDFALVRYLADGSLDRSFNPGGLTPGTVQINIQDLLSPIGEVVLEPIDEGITALAFAEDDKIIAAGFASVGLNSAFVIAKLNEDGSLDSAFNATGALGPIPGIAFISFGILSDITRGIAVDSQNRIVLVGSSDNGQNIDLVVVRLTSEGKLDITFNPQSPVVGSSAFNFGALTIGQQPASFRSPGVYVLRDEETVTPLTDQGDQSAASVEITTDDRIVVGGSVGNIDFSVDAPELNTDFIIVKLTADGRLDTTFNTQSTRPGIVTQDFQIFDDEAFALKIDSRNRIVIGGLTNSGDASSFGLSRYTENGMLDVTFNANGFSQGVPGTVITTIETVVGTSTVTNSLSELRGLAIQPDNKIIAVGSTDDLNDRSFATIRYTETGVLDTTFNDLGATPGIVITTLQPTEETLNDTAINAENHGQGVALGTDNLIYITGFSNDGVQNNFTTINYLESGLLNSLFNSTGEVSNQAGIVITKFGNTLASLGNGVPIEVTKDLTGVSPSIIQALTYPPLPFEPFVFEESLQSFRSDSRVLAGQSSPNAVISLFVNEVQAGASMANKSGYWHVTLPFLVKGVYEISLVATDPLTGVSFASQPVRLLVSNEAPMVPSINSPGVNLQVTSDMTQFAGSAEPGTMVVLVVDTVEQVETVALQDGSWSTKVTLPDGKHYVTAQAINSAGSRSGVSDQVPFSVSVGDRVAPKITSPTPGAMMANSTIYITGSSQPEAEIKVVINDKPSQVKTDKKGSWSVPIVNARGNYEVVAMHDGRISEKVRFSVVHAKK